MMRLFAAVGLALCLFGAIAQPSLARDKTINFKTGDPEMAAPIDKARATLPAFWVSYENPTEGVNGHSLKVAITEPGNPSTEHFWLIDIKKRPDGRFSGIINNDPNYIRSVQRGQRYVFSEDMISDWLFLRNGKMVGIYTMRPMLKRMPKAQADRYRAMLESP